MAIVFSGKKKDEDGWTSKTRQVMIQTLSKDSAYLMTIVSVVATPGGGVIGRYPILV
jgi:hypothetical protein